MRGAIGRDKLRDPAGNESGSRSSIPRPGLVNRFFGTRYTDLCYGFNAFWSYCLPSLDVDCDGFEVETLLNIRATRSGLKVVEVPSFEHARLHGVSTSGLGPTGCECCGRC